MYTSTDGQTDRDRQADNHKVLDWEGAIDQHNWPYLAEGLYQNLRTLRSRSGPVGPHQVSNRSEALKG